MSMSPAPIRQNIYSGILRPVLYSFVVLLFGTGLVFAAETDDASLFVEAFTAYQNSDYQLAIEKLGTMGRLFPESPLRDVSLLLLARSGLKSGDNELAARTIVRFTTEFSSNPLGDTIEIELQLLARRWQAGEKLPQEAPLRTASRNTRSGKKSVGSSGTEMPGQIPVVASESGHLEDAGSSMGQRNPLPENTVDSAVMVSIVMPGTVQVIPAGQPGEVPFELVNRSTSIEEVVLEPISPPGFDSALSLEGRAPEKRSRVTIAAAAVIKGTIRFTVPTDMIDGQRATIYLRAMPDSSQHVQTREARVIAAAPLLRLVARTERQRLAPGAHTRYRVTALNVGALPARYITATVFLPPQIEFLNSGGTPFSRGAAGEIIFHADTLDPGRLAEYTLNVKIREEAVIGQELLSRVELVHGRSPGSERAVSSVTVAQGDQTSLPAGR